MYFEVIAIYIILLTVTALSTFVNSHIMEELSNFHKSSYQNGH